LSLVVVIADRGVVRWTAVGVRRSCPFRSSKTSRRSFRLAVDRAALAARSTAPDDVARKLLEVSSTGGTGGHAQAASH